MSTKTFQKVVPLVLISLLSLMQVYAHPQEDHFSVQRGNNAILNTIDNIIDLGKTLLDKPYRSVVSGGKVLDCSGFVSYIYGQNGFAMPNSSASIASLSEKVNLSEVQKGDLLFFKGRNINSSRVGHVSMVTWVDGGVIEMMHSCRRGIMVEKYNSNSYYTSRLLFAGRWPQLASLESLAIDANTMPGIAEISDSTQTNHLDTTVQHSFEASDTVPVPPKAVTIIGVGDIMLGTNFPNPSYLPPNDGRDILHPVKEIISKGDVSFGNLEGVILTGEGKVKKCANPEVCYAFKMPDHYVDYLVEAGFNLLSVANNHVRDFGSVGTANTIRILNEAKIPHAGLEECPYTTFEKNGIRYGFAAFAPNTGTIKMNDYANAKKIISHLDTISDIVIISFHGGAEGATKKHINRKTEMFLGENRGNPYEFARMAIDAGADVVLGHGPHVTRAIDIYKDRFIAYSLGNFATYGRFNLSGPNGVAPIVELNLDTDGTFIDGKIHSTKQVGRGGPIMDEQNRALREIQELTRVDIPESLLSIDSDGTITKKREITKR